MAGTASAKALRPAWSGVSGEELRGRFGWSRGSQWPWRRGRRGQEGPCGFPLSDRGTERRAVSREGQNPARRWLSLRPGQSLPPRTGPEDSSCRVARPGLWGAGFTDGHGPTCGCCRARTHAPGSGWPLQTLGPQAFPPGVWQATQASGKSAEAGRRQMASWITGQQRKFHLDARRPSTVALGVSSCG